MKKIFLIGVGVIIGLSANLGASRVEGGNVQSDVVLVQDREVNLDGRVRSRPARVTVTPPGPDTAIFCTHDCIVETEIIEQKIYKCNKRVGNTCKYVETSREPACK